VVQLPRLVLICTRFAAFWDLFSIFKKSHQETGDVQNCSVCLTLRVAYRQEGVAATPKMEATMNGKQELVRLTVRLPGTTYDALKAASDSQVVPMAILVRQALAALITAAQDKVDE